MDSVGGSRGRWFLAGTTGQGVVLLRSRGKSTSLNFMILCRRVGRGGEACDNYFVATVPQASYKEFYIHRTNYKIHGAQPKIKYAAPLVQKLRISRQESRAFRQARGLLTRGTV